MIVADPSALARLVEQLRGSPHIALDTEFVRDRQYYPQLEIIQIATEEVAAVVDFRALGRLGALESLLFDPTITKIVHAGGQDMEIFYNLTGRVPAPLFDTQVAAAMIGMGMQIGYSRLVEAVSSVTLNKRETLTDWSRRPLTEAQIAYALDDVRYLLPAYDFLRSELARMGRSEWVEEELRVMEQPEQYARVEPREAYQRVKGATKLRPRELAVLRELAAWREEEGVRRDRAVPLIVRDDVLVALARRAPTTRQELSEVRGLHEREIQRSGQEMIAAVARGSALPRSEWPASPDYTRLSEQESSLVAMLQGWLRSRSDELGIAVSYLATSSELRDLVTSDRDRWNRHPLMRGWRRRLVGDELAALLDGRAGLVWSPEDGQMTLLRTDS